MGNNGAKDNEEMKLSVDTENMDPVSEPEMTEEELERQRREDEERAKRAEETSYVAIGLFSGGILGAVIGAVIGNVAIGGVVGGSLGLLFGLSLDYKRGKTRIKND